MSGTNPAPEPGKPAAKPRNPVEQAIVRGFIGVLLVLVAVEAFPWYSHRQAVEALQKKMKAVDESADSPAVTEADVKEAVGGKQPAESKKLDGMAMSNGAGRLDIYSWFTLNPLNKREMYVYYGHQGKNESQGPEVLAVQPDDKFPEPPKPVELTDEQKAEQEKMQAQNPMAGGMGGMRGPPGGGMMGPPGGGHSGRPGGGKKAASEADKSDGDTTDTEKSATDEPASDKSTDKKPADADADAKDADPDKDQ